MMKLIKKSNEKIVFTVEMNTTLANAIRRSVNEIPILAIDEVEISKNSEWVSWNKDLNRKELVSLVARHKYGIHGMENEHFGIAVAELVNAGCVTFVPKSGGQMEIVEDSRLMYLDVSDAVEKIRSVLESDDLQSKLRGKLCKKCFSNKIFKDEVLRIVNEEINGINTTGQALDPLAHAASCEGISPL